VAAIEAGYYADQIVPVTVPQPKGEPIVVERDEHPRPDTSAEALARLRPAFRDGGSITAGNSSGINDGAAAAVLVEAGFGRRHGLQPLTRVVSSGAGEPQGARARRPGRRRP
jgi:acetyl-CoA acetyltransferase